MHRADGKLGLNVVRVLLEECNKEVYNVAENSDGKLVFFFFFLAVILNVVRCILTGNPLPSPKQPFLPEEKGQSLPKST